MPNLDESLWTILIVSERDAKPIRVKALEAAPAPGDVWHCLVDAMQEPLDREPRRPARIAVCQPTLLKSWKLKPKQLHIQCVVVDSLDLIDLAREQLSAQQVKSAAPHAEAAEPENPLDLPQEINEIWQADVRQMPAWITGEGQPYRAWMAIVLDRTNDLVLSHRLTPERLEADSLWEAVREGLFRPAAGEPHRPQAIEVGSDEAAAALRHRFEHANIEVDVLERLDALELVLDDMAQSLGGPGTLPSLIQVPGMQPSQVGSFYAAAAEFYRQRPWQQVPGDSVIRIECGKFRSGPFYAVVMGQSGIQQGLAIYEDLAALQAMIAGEGSEAEHARGMSVLSLMYGEAFEMPARDLDAAEQFGWPVAGPEAYPLILRVNPGLATRPPLGWELELMEASLHDPRIPAGRTRDHHNGANGSRRSRRAVGARWLRPREIACDREEGKTRERLTKIVQIPFPDSD